MLITVKKSAQSKCLNMTQTSPVFEIRLQSSFTINSSRMLNKNKCIVVDTLGDQSHLDSINILGRINSGRMPLQPDSSILIIGAGALGISTAVHLTRRGYKNVVCIDKHPVPSPESAGTDLNKIVRAEYEDVLYTKMASEAMSAWKDPYWHSIYHETGRLATTSGDAEYEDNLRRSYDNLKRAGQASTIEFLHSRDDIIRHCPNLSNSPAISTWKGQWNSCAGWVQSSKAMETWAGEARARGVKFLSGQAATMVSLERDEDGQLAGVRVKSGKVLSADHYVLCIGAASSVILPHLTSSILRPVGTLVAYIELTDEEYSKWKGIPVIDNLELGYAFEPDHETKRIKIGGMHRYGCRNAGYDHVDQEINDSTGNLGPLQAFNRQRRAPKKAVEAIKQFVSAVMPELSDRPLVGAKLCWDADTPDGHFVIDRAPQHPELLIATGGSQHAFKMFPVIGDYIVDALEGKGRGLKPEWKFGHRSAARDSMYPDEDVEYIEDVELIPV
ncbi:fructosyl amine:oxygen oxidoreductase [Purpureocillium lavendulum]|uniref:Fructosyl amine:oxygen oxidoreductase n=1 Tax=Purpureocillium lavendulum TaxID=1247861 RepID=A0AB34FPI5_9HYPO|nr:fructosyl amine:oxygen oxidoreductase [Purpureocillium lavendulum]